LGYGYVLGICVVLFVLLTGGFGVLLWTIINRKEIKRSLLTHPNDRKRTNADARDEQRESQDLPEGDLQTDAPDDEHTAL